MRGPAVTWEVHGAKVPGEFWGILGKFGDMGGLGDWGGILGPFGGFWGILGRLEGS